MATLNGLIGAREREHAEVEAVLAALGRSPLMARLFSYICDQYFAGKSAELNQAKIAAEVFNRSESFDRTRDSIARVEIHRLRKKLKQYYQSEGQDHPVQIEILPGSYAPVFRYIEVPDSDTCAVAERDYELCSELRHVTVTPATTPTSITTAPAAGLHWNRKSTLLSVALAIPILVLTYYGFLYLSGLSKARAAKPVGSSLHRASTPPATPAVIDGAVRFLCGYNGPVHIGPLGHVWGPDKFFHGGSSRPLQPGFIRRTSDASIFRTARVGEFSYDIPVKPGVYELHLYFVETEYGEELGGGENSRTFSIHLNGAFLKTGFDPLSDAGGPRIADERVFKDVQPAADGKVHLGFESEHGEPMISAIELVPGTPHRQLPIRIATRANSYTDQLGRMWSQDNYYMGGQIFGDKPRVTGTADPTLFQTERIGHFTYAIPVDTSGTYSATLYFAETYFGPGASGVGGAGSRVFNVMCNGVMLLDHFDIFREAGTAHALVKSFHHLKPTAQGKLNFAFEPVANYASLFAMEVVDESK